MSDTKQKSAVVQRAVQRSSAETRAPDTFLREIKSRQQLHQMIAQKNHDGSRAYLVTPQLATWLLELNTGNRRVSRMRVDKYKHIIETNLWMNTGEPIIVSDTGVLNEGQHRLLAIKDAGKTVPCDIRFGISRAAFTATGTGATRSVADVISLTGVSTYAMFMASGARLLIEYQLGLPAASHTQLVPEEIYRAVNRWHDDLLRAVKMVMVLADKHGLKFKNSAAIAFTFLALRSKNEATVAEFMEIVASGMVQAREAGNPARVLYERLRREQDEPKGNRSREATMERLAAFIKAWNFWLANEQIRAPALRWTRDRVQNDPFPEVAGVKF